MQKFSLAQRRSRRLYAAWLAWGASGLPRSTEASRATAESKAVAAIEACNATVAWTSMAAAMADTIAAAWRPALVG